MNRKRATDLTALFVWLTLAVIVYMYLQENKWYGLYLAVSGLLVVFFLVLAVRDGEKGKRNISVSEEGFSDSGMIVEAVLLSEEDTELHIWDIYGKTALVIGRDVKENQVDIDLSESPCAGMVDMEHAVMNYSAGNWYIEDLGSKNGIRVKKAWDGKVYQISADTPCRLGRGDILYVGMNRILLR